MSAQLIDGKALAERIREDLTLQVEKMSASGHMPHLVPLMVGESAASKMYVKRQRRSCRDLGIDCTPVNLPEEITQEDLEAEIKKINADPSVTGIMLTLPLPGALDGRRAQQMIAPEKDVEGVVPGNLGKLVLGDELMAPTTAKAAFELARSTRITLEGAEVVIVGHSDIVGKPLALLFLDVFSTVTVCHIATRDLASHTRRADVLCVGVGKPGLVTGDMIKPGAVVVDIGINRVPKLDADGNQVYNKKGKPAKTTVGDVVFEEASEVAAWITPVPGGVGPMNVATLLQSAVGSARAQFGV